MHAALESILLHLGAAAAAARPLLDDGGRVIPAGPSPVL